MSTSTTIRPSIATNTPVQIAVKYFVEYQWIFKDGAAIVLVDRYPGKTGVHVIHRDSAGWWSSTVVGLFETATANELLDLAARSFGRYQTTRSNWRQLNEAQQSMVKQMCCLPMEWNPEGVMERDDMYRKVQVFFDAPQPVNTHFNGLGR